MSHVIIVLKMHRTHRGDAQVLQCKGEGVQTLIIFLMLDPERNASHYQTQLGLQDNGLLGMNKQNIQTGKLCPSLIPKDIKYIFQFVNKNHVKHRITENFLASPWDNKTGFNLK